MRGLILLACVAALTGCSRPSTGFSFNDLVWATSAGLREYEEWVEQEPDQYKLPNMLCLAGVHFTASLAETKTRSVDVGLPLAAPAIGLTGMLGYKFISTESNSGLISASLLARYQQPDEKKANRKQILADFTSTIPDTYKDQKIETRKGPRQPEGLDIANKGPFAERDDLAAELWRIRDALHAAVLSSPVSSSGGGYVLEPQPVTMVVNYTLSEAKGFRAAVKLGGRADASFGAGSGVTENNKMVLVYMQNQSKNPMVCSEASFGKPKDFDAAFKQAVKEALGKNPPGAPEIPIPNG